MSNIVEPNWLTVTGLVFLFSGLVVLCTAVQSGSWGGQRVARGSTLGSYQRAASAMSAVLIAVGLGAQLLGQFFIAPLATSIVVVLLALALFLLFFALTADMLFEAPRLALRRQRVAAYRATPPMPLSSKVGRAPRAGCASPADPHLSRGPAGPRPSMP